MPPTSPTTDVVGLFSSKRTAGFGKPVPPVNVHVPVAFSPVVAAIQIGLFADKLVEVPQSCWSLPALTTGRSSIHTSISSESVQKPSVTVQRKV